MEGWIKLHRKMLENALFMKADYFQVWSFILLSVGHKDNKIIWNNEEKTIPKGAGIFSQKLISEKLKIPISKVNRILKYLENGKQIEIKSTNKFTEIQVVNWGDYQEYAENGNQTETKQKPSGNLTETNKNVKNEKKEKNIYSDFGFCQNGFMEVWDEYRKMRAKLKKPLTPYAEELALKDVQRFSGGEKEKAIQVVQQSIKNSWQGLFELKRETQGSKTMPKLMI